MDPKELLTIVVQVFTACIGIWTLLGGVKGLRSGTIRGSFQSQYQMQSWSREQNPTAFYFFVTVYLLSAVLALGFLAGTLLGYIDLTV